MSIPTTDELLQTLKARVTDPDRQLMLATIAADLTRISAQALVDPVNAEREARYVRAQISNLAATEQLAVQDAFTEWAGRLVFALVTAAFA